MKKTEQAPELEPDMAGVLELSGWEFQTTMIIVLRALMEKADNMQEQMGNISGDLEIPRKNQK